MAQRLIPLGRAADPRLELLSTMHDTRLALEFGALADRGIVAANGLIGAPRGGAQVWPDGLITLDRNQSQSLDFSTNFGLGTGPYFVLFGATVPPGLPSNGCWLKLGDPTGAGAGYGFGLSGGGATGFETSGRKLTALYEDRAWLASTQELPDGFHTVCFYHDGEAAKAVHFFVDGVAVDLVIGAAPPLAPSEVARFGGYTSSSSANRHTSCKLHFALIGTLRAGAVVPLDLAEVASRIYPPGEYVPHTAQRSTFYSLPSASLAINSITASNITQTGARITLGLTR